jgi:hypothetical protein
MLDIRSKLLYGLIGKRPASNRNTRTPIAGLSRLIIYGRRSPSPAWPFHRHRESAGPIGLDPIRQG